MLVKVNSATIDERIVRLCSVKSPSGTLFMRCANRDGLSIKES